MPAIKTRVEPIDRDIALLIDETLSPKAQSQLIAEVARGMLADAQAVNQRAMGRVPRHETFVDGRKGAALESVKPSGRIVFEFDVLLDLFAWIGAQLVQHSPVGAPPAPAYAASHLFFADGVQVQPGGKVPEASRYEFVNSVEYSRKIERGLSPQAPDGVYQVVAKLASKRFGGVARIRFGFSSVVGVKGRQPAIVITVGGR